MNENEIIEEWKPICGYEGFYEISNFGKVKSLKNNHGDYREKIIKGKINKYGYHVVCLCVNNKRKYYQTHRLVAKTFIPNPNNLETVNHKDENKLNNRIDNLEWMSSINNTRYGTGISRRAEKISKQVYQFDLQYNIIKIWQSTQECGRNGFCQSNVAECCRGNRKFHKGFIWSYKDISKKQEN